LNISIIDAPGGRYRWTAEAPNIGGTLPVPASILIVSHETWECPNAAETDARLWHDRQTGWWGDRRVWQQI